MNFFRRSKSEKKHRPKSDSAAITYADGENGERERIADKPRLASDSAVMRISDDPSAAKASKDKDNKRHSANSVLIDSNEKASKKNKDKEKKSKEKDKDKEKDKEKDKKSKAKDKDKKRQASDSAVMRSTSERYSVEDRNSDAWRRRSDNDNYENDDCFVQQFEGKMMTNEISSAVKAEADRVIVSMMVPTEQIQRPRMRKQQLLSNSDFQPLDDAIIAVSTLSNLVSLFSL